MILFCVLCVLKQKKWLPRSDCFTTEEFATVNPMLLLLPFRPEQHKILQNNVSQLITDNTGTAYVYSFQAPLA